MSIIQMRGKIRRAYSGTKWTDKVNGMNDDQIIAIYYRLLNQGKLK